MNIIRTLSLKMVSTILRMSLLLTLVIYSYILIWPHGLKAACLQMSQHISKLEKYILRLLGDVPTYFKTWEIHTKIIRKVKFQNSSNTLHVIYNLELILQYFSPYIFCMTNTFRTFFEHLNLFFGNSFTWTVSVVCNM
jgi:hypothetical protein